MNALAVSQFFQDSNSFLKLSRVQLAFFLRDASLLSNFGESVRATHTLLCLLLVRFNASFHLRSCPVAGFHQSMDGNTCQGDATLSCKVSHL